MNVAVVAVESNAAAGTAAVAAYWLNPLVAVNTMMLEAELWCSREDASENNRQKESFLLQL